MEQRRIRTGLVGLGGIFYGWGGGMGLAKLFPKIEELQLSSG